MAPGSFMRSAIFRQVMASKGAREAKKGATNASRMDSIAPGAGATIAHDKKSCPADVSPGVRSIRSGFRPAQAPAPAAPKKK